jgi:radical SAM superfamily enzyme YgiQ (UPF0313 family)
MRLVLAAAPTPGNRHRQAENLGLRYLAAAASAAGHEVAVLDGTDTGLPVERFVEQVAAMSPSLVGFAVQFADQAGPTVQAADQLREAMPSVTIIAGGQALNFGWQDLMGMTESIAGAACFEADSTFLAYVSWTEAKQVGEPPEGFYIRDGGSIIFTGFAQPVTDLDSVPFPMRDGQSRVYGDPNFVMLTSRGCQSGCTFCSSGFFGNRYHQQDRWRSRSVANIMAELDQLVNTQGARAISFADDDFLGGSAADGTGRERAHAFAAALKASEMEVAYSIELRADETVAGERELVQLASCGLAHVLIGIDGLTKRDLKLYSKRVTMSLVEDAVGIIDAVGLTASYGAILFNPLTTADDLLEGIGNLSRLAIAKSDHFTNKLQLYRGSPLVPYLERQSVALRWVPELFRYDYALSDETDAIHSAFKRIGALVRPVELDLARARFRISTGLAAPDPHLHQALRSTARELSARLCEQAATVVANPDHPVTQALENALAAATRTIADLAAA